MGDYNIFSKIDQLPLNIIFYENNNIHVMTVVGNDEYFTLISVSGLDCC